MIVCQRCSKENQDHYKFCLGCGAEIFLPPSDVADVMKTIMTDPASTPLGAPGGSPLGPPPGVALPASIAPPTPVAVAEPAQPMVQPSMAQSAMAQSPIGQPMAPSQEPAYSSLLHCTQCNAEIPTNFKFCGACGTPIPILDHTPTPTPYSQQDGVASAAQVAMTLILPDGTEGGTHPLQPGINHLGRNHGEIFESDGYLSPTHAELHISASGNHFIRDLGSLNGIFVRMTEEQEILPTQVIRIGQELLRFDRMKSPSMAVDGTDVMGSPNPGYWGLITVIIGKNATGAVFPLLSSEITIGRENGDINFPDDGYVSGMHARLVARDNRFYLVDLGSSNGTFIKVTHEQHVPNHSFVLLGQQLFKITSN